MNDDLILDFDTDLGEPKQSFDPLPPGDYAMTVTGVEVVPTSKGGTQLKVELTVDDREYAGRKVWDRINIRNASEKAQKFGLDTLTGLLRAAGIAGERDMSRLIDRRVVARLKVRVDPGYSPSNDVRGYLSADTPRVVKDSPTTTTSADTRPAFLKNKV